MRGREISIGKAIDIDDVAERMRAHVTSISLASRARLASGSRPIIIHAGESMLANPTVDVARGSLERKLIEKQVEKEKIARGFSVIAWHDAEETLKREREAFFKKESTRLAKEVEDPALAKEFREHPERFPLVTAERERDLKKLEQKERATGRQRKKREKDKQEKELEKAEIASHAKAIAAKERIIETVANQIWRESDYNKSKKGSLEEARERLQKEEQAAALQAARERSSRQDSSKPRVTME